MTECWKSVNIFVKIIFTHAVEPCKEYRGTSRPRLLLTALAAQYQRGRLYRYVTSDIHTTLSIKIRYLATLESSRPVGLRLLPLLLPASIVDVVSRYGMVYYGLTFHSTQYRSFRRRGPWAVMCTSHSVMEGQRHNNPLNPRCFCLQRPKRDGTSFQPTL